MNDPALPSLSAIRATIDQARQAQAQARGPTTKVGAVLWKLGPEGEPHILTRGGNGFPKGIRPTAQRLDANIELDLHAEMAAVADAARQGIAIKGAFETTTHCNCPMCALVKRETEVSKSFVDGRQKMRPNYVRNWLPEKSLSFDILRLANVEVQVHGLRLLNDGEPDLMMSPKESADGCGIRLSDAEIPAMPNAGLSIYRSAVEKLPMSGIARSEDHWLSMPHRLDIGSAASSSPPIARVAGRIDRLIKERRQTGSTHSEHAAAIMGDENRSIAFGTESGELPSYLKLDAATVLVAHAARDGVRMKGKTVFSTHIPNPLGAIMLVGAGVRAIELDGRNLPGQLDRDMADTLVKSWIALKEGGVKILVDGKRADEWLIHWLSKNASPELIALLNPTKESTSMAGMFSQGIAYQRGGPPSHSR